ncbi:MAG: CoA ester lyase [Syntrophomonadaceae bacterium]|nr:CoA ester lyase [Syntrophomonadaceae bacterium]
MELIRTFLFTPGNNEIRVEKAYGLGADAVILDLEDAVAVTEKKAARQMVKAILAKPRNVATFVRVNSLPTGFFYGDLVEMVQPGLDGIILPKSETAEDVLKVDWLISLLEQEKNLPAGKIDLIPLVESALGILNAKEIAAACARVSRVAFGAIDYTLDIGTSCSQAGSELFYARAQLVAASRAAGKKPPVDTVYPDIKDIEGLLLETKIVKQLGFFGKMVIHPNQIDPVNKVFSPTEEEVLWASKVAAAFDQAEAQGTASIQLEGKFIDYPVAMRAKRTLQLAAAIAGKKP